MLHTHSTHVGYITILPDPFMKAGNTRVCRGCYRVTPLYSLYPIRIRPNLKTIV